MVSGLLTRKGPVQTESELFQDWSLRSRKPKEHSRWLSARHRFTETYCLGQSPVAAGQRGSDPHAGREEAG